MTHYRDRLNAGEFAPNPDALARAAAADQAADAELAARLDSLTRDELREQARAAGVPTTGTKAELIARLVAE